MDSVVFRVYFALFLELRGIMMIAWYRAGKRFVKL